jgi:hypothetical protein
VVERPRAMKSKMGYLDKWRPLACVAALLANAGPAFAGDGVAAEALFQAGLSLLDAGQLEEACPKLAESYRLEPATGALLALATCHERDQKLATAWAEYVEAAARSKLERRAERHLFASERAAALRRRVSTLSVQVPEDVAATPGLSVERDGVLLERAAWNVPIPTDGGEHAVQASAPQKQTWRASVVVEVEATAQQISVPPLMDVPRAESRHWTPLEWAGASAAGVGVVELGIGGFFLAGALARSGERDGAEARGNLATFFGVTGAVLIGGGASLFWLGRQRASNVPPSVGLWTGPSERGGWLVGAGGSL